jgi:tRNA-binding protein
MSHKDQIKFSDFEKIEIRTGTIVEVNDFPKAHKPAYQLVIDFGDKGFRKSSAQITQLYTKEVLLGMQVVAVLNFGSKQIANFISECLVLGAVANNGEVSLLTPSKKCENGLIVS